jgi:hypothetical protein
MERASILPCLLPSDDEVFIGIKYPSLEDTWMNMSNSALENILVQLVRFHIATFSFLHSGRESGRRNYGSVRLSLAGSSPSEEELHTATITSGPVLEETMWGVPDVKRYFHASPWNLSEESVSSLNPSSPSGYRDYPAYVAAFLRTYSHVIRIHPRVSFLTHVLPALDKAIAKLEATDEHVEPWVTRLRTEDTLKGYLWHRDIHFGNILVDPENGEWKAVLDWEFAGVGVCLPSFRFSPVG